MPSETKIVSIVQDAILLRQPDAKPALESRTLTKIELDERCFVFPDGKVASHLLIIREGPDRLCFDAVFTFNGTRLPGRLLDLTLEELKLFARELLDSVYAAKSGFVLRDTLKISIVVVANGYRIEFQRAQQKSEIYLSTGAIWRVLRGLLVAADEASPVISH